MCWDKDLWEWNAHRLNTWAGTFYISKTFLKNMRFFSFVKQLTVLPLTFLSKKASGACPTALTGLLHPAPLGTLYACVWTPQNISLYMWPLLGCKNEQASIVVCHQGTSRKRLTQTLEDRKFGLLGTQRLVEGGCRLRMGRWGWNVSLDPWIPPPAGWDVIRGAPSFIIPHPQLTSIQVLGARWSHVPRLNLPRVLGKQMSSFHSLPWERQWRVENGGWAGYQGGSQPQLLQKVKSKNQ